MIKARRSCCKCIGLKNRKGCTEKERYTDMSSLLGNLVPRQLRAEHPVCVGRSTGSMRHVFAFHLIHTSSSVQVSFPRKYCSYLSSSSLVARGSSADWGYIGGAEAETNASCHARRALQADILSSCLTIVRFPSRQGESRLIEYRTNTSTELDSMMALYNLVFHVDGKTLPG
ncbi:hypothetical protein RRG08_019958 [Elysia crispata]|uniref:Uncharacterized protein n=1 Tax=Elysia crispata TaxID=231223 RepID=A0AAE1CZD8_9GAST|nr:hypothetical protein RRG08_019958 [Elysia crispata]